MAAGAPVPLHRAQRRDQHAARQHQLDARARGAARVRRAWRRSEEDPAGDPRRRQRYRHVRQRPRDAGDGGAVAAARHPDDDSRAVERQPGDGPRAEGVLPVPRLAHGAVGRSGLDRVHRRHRRRRGARPQRPASVALLRDEGRPRHHGVGSRRARSRAGRRRGQGAAPPGPHLPGRHGARPHRGRRGDQERAGGAASVSPVARRPHRRHRRPAGRGRRGARSRNGAEAPAGVRLHAGGSARADRADGDERRGAGRIDGDRHVAGRAVAAAAPAVRLLQAAVRAGHQPAARRDPRATRDRHGLDDRPRTEPAEARTGVVPADPDQVPDHPQRARGEAAAPAGRIGIQVDDAVAAVRRRQGRRRDSSRRWPSCAAARARRSGTATTS